MAEEFIPDEDFVPDGQPASRITVRPQTPVGKALEPLTSYPRVYNEMQKQSREEIARGVGQIGNPESGWDVAKGVGNVALGGLGYAMSPISAAYRTVVGQPVQDVTGIPREYTEFVAGLATPGLGMARLPRAPLPPAPQSRVHPTGVTLSEGQFTGDLPTIQREQSAIRGQSGAKPQAVAQRFVDQQAAQIDQAGQNVMQGLDRYGQVIAESPQQAADVAQRTIRSEAARARAGVDTAYATARSLPGDVHLGVFEGITPKVKYNLSNAPEPIIIDELTPRASKALSYIEDQVSNLRIRNDADPFGSKGIPSDAVGVTLSGIDQWRKNLVAMRRDAYASGNGADGRAMSAVVNQFDNIVDDAINGGLFSGDQRAVRAWNVARASHADYRSTFAKGKNDPVGRVVEKVLGDRTNAPAIPNDVADFLYGSAGVNPNSLNLGVARRFQEILGPASPEWSGVKQGMWTRLTERPQGFSNKQIADRIDRFLNTDGVEMANFMYTPSQRDLMRNYADLMRRTTVPQAGANWSGTARPVIDKINTWMGGIVGAAVGHVVGAKMGIPFGGELIGFATKNIPKRISENREAKQIARQMPVLAHQMQQWSRAVSAAQQAPSSITRRAAMGASINLDASLQKLGTSLNEMMTGPQLPAASRAGDEQEGPRPPAQKQDGGQVSGQRGFAKGGRVEASNIDHEPTEAQKEAGNYAKDHIRIQGLDITVENACGKYRRGVDRGGKAWAVKMPAHYGYIKRTLGKDGDHVDVYVGPHPRMQVVYVLDQMDADTGKFDEHKAFVGFASEKQVRGVYRRCFNDGKADKRFGHLATMSIDDFKAWLDKGDTTKPVKHRWMGGRVGMAEGGVPNEWEEVPRSASGRPQISVGPRGNPLGEEGVPFFPDAPVVDEAAEAQRAREAAAYRMQQSVAPQRGREPGLTTKIMEAIPLGIGESAYRIGTSPFAAMERLYQQYDPNFRGEVSDSDISPETIMAGWTGELGSLMLGGYRGKLLELPAKEAPAVVQPSVRFAANAANQDTARTAVVNQVARNVDDLGFYSHGREVALQIPQETGTPQQMRAMLERQGVKKEEFENAGWDSAFAGRPSVSKQEIAELFDENRVQLREVVKGGPPTAEALAESARKRELAKVAAKQYREFDQSLRDKYGLAGPAQGADVGVHATPEEIIQLEGLRRQWADADAGSYVKPGSDLKYHGWQEPGGENYRELLLTMPSEGGDAFKAAREKAVELKRQTADLMAEWKRLAEENPPGHPDTLAAYQRLADSRVVLRDAGEAAMSLRNAVAEKQYKSSHWDEPNVLAHMRYNDREIDGKKALFIEEIQSDWHQAGRKKGYKKDEAEVRAELDQLAKETSTMRRSDDPARWDRLIDRSRELVSKIDGVPDAPFKTSWPDLALKRMMKYAADNGYDKVSWTPGRVQADRYDLSKQIKELYYQKRPDGNYELGFLENSGNRPPWQTVPEAKLADTVGKDVADRILQDKGEKIPFGEEGAKKLSGLDLKVGGEGMIGFYDKMLPSIAGKLVKPYGVKPYTVDMISVNPSGADDIVQGAHVIDITPEMRADLQKGVRMFANKVDPKTAARNEVMQAAAEAHPDWIGTRLVTSKKATPSSSPEIVDLDAMRAVPELFKHNVGLVQAYPNMPKGGGKPEEVATRFIDHVKSNLLWLHDKVDPQTAARSAKWYDGGRKIVDDWSRQYGRQDSSVAAAIAALSPQKDWFQNVSLAERVLQTAAKPDVKFTPEMLSTFKSIPALNKPDYKPLIKQIEGKSLDQIDGMSLPADEKAVVKALWVRLYDQAHRSPSYKLVTPEGEFGDTVKNMSGSESRVAWGSLVEVSKALRALDGGGATAIGPLMGQKHKVRNFYNNLLDPQSQRGDVTIDTHAVAAGLLRPLSGNSLEVAHNFANYPGKGLPSAAGSAISGIQGTYPLYAEAYRKAAQERGLLPRQMQSITWEAVRGLFPDTFKNAKNTAEIDAIWRAHRNGETSLEQARQAVFDRAGGINPPDWASRPVGGADAPTGNPGQPGGLPRSSVSGRSPDVVGRAGSGPPAGLETRPGGSAAVRGAELEDTVRGVRQQTGLPTPANQGRVPASYGRGSPEGDREFGSDLIAATWRPLDAVRDRYTKAGISAPTFNELKPDASSVFYDALKASKASHPSGAAVTLYSPEDYAGMRTFLTPDKTAGFALKGDDIVSVFKTGKTHANACIPMLDIAVANGGRRLDAFDTVLPHIYSRSGFRVVARTKFNPEFAPEGWDYEMFKNYNKGKPDVVFMVYDPSHPAVYKNGDGKMAKSYDDAVRIQEAEAAKIDKKYQLKKMPPPKARGGSVTSKKHDWYSSVIRRAHAH